MIRCVILLLVLFCTLARGDPSISSGSGTLLQGETYTITGTNFGAKVTSAPLRYDDFQDGAVGERLKGQASGGWLTGGVSHYPHYSTDDQRVAGEIVVEQHYDYVNYNQTIGFDTISESPPFNWVKMYVSWWVHRVDIQDSRLSTNLKLWCNFETWHADSAYFDLPQHRVAGNDNPMWTNIYGYDVGGNLLCNTGFAAQPWWDNEFADWVRIERYLDSGTTNGNDTYSYFVENCSTLVEAGPGCGSMLEDADPTHRPTVLLLGHYWRAMYDGQESKNYTGEIYADTTQARVELGNASTWSACTHREIQVPTAWADDEISFTTNMGTFTADSTMWLFVVDGAGVVDSSGYSVGAAEGGQYHRTKYYVEGIETPGGGQGDY